MFVIIGTLGPGIPVAIYFTMGDKGTILLARLKTSMGLHNAAIMTVLVIAAKLLGDGISGLSV